MGIEKEIKSRLRELRLLLWSWRIGLFVLTLLFVAIVGWPIYVFGLIEICKKIAADNVLAAITAASLAAFVATFGHLLSNYSIFRKQYIEISKTTHDELQLRRQRLVAFNAEIHENKKTIMNYYSQARRSDIVSKLESDPEHLFFTKSDNSNPIFEDNRSHLYSFSNETIRGIINYYNAEANLNLSIETLSSPEFKQLVVSQRLAWMANMLFSCNSVYHGANEAMFAIKSEIFSLRDKKHINLTLEQFSDRLDDHIQFSAAKNDSDRIPEWVDVTVPTHDKDEKAELYLLYELIKKANANSSLRSGSKADRNNSKPKVK
jgi:hypothetical protein